MSPKSQYVKPLVMQLHYTVERTVAQAGGCKDTNSVSGADNIGNCEAVLGGTCNQLGS